MSPNPLSGIHPGAAVLLNLVRTPSRWWRHPEHDLVFCHLLDAAAGTRDPRVQARFGRNHYLLSTDGGQSWYQLDERSAPGMVTTDKSCGIVGKIGLRAPGLGHPLMAKISPRAGTRTTTVLLYGNGDARTALAPALLPHTPDADLLASATVYQLSDRHELRWYGALQDGRHLAVAIDLFAGSGRPVYRIWCGTPGATPPAELTIGYASEDTPQRYRVELVEARALEIRPRARKDGWGDNVQVTLWEQSGNRRSGNFCDPRTAPTTLLPHIPLASADMVAKEVVHAFSQTIW